MHRDAFRVVHWNHWRVNPSPIKIHMSNMNWTAIVLDCKLNKTSNLLIHCVRIVFLHFSMPSYERSHQQRKDVQINQWSKWLVALFVLHHWTNQHHCVYFPPPRGRKYVAVNHCNYPHGVSCFVYSNEWFHFGALSCFFSSCNNWLWPSEVKM